MTTMHTQGLFFLLADKINEWLKLNIKDGRGFIKYSNSQNWKTEIFKAQGHRIGIDNSKGCGVGCGPFDNGQKEN